MSSGKQVDYLFAKLNHELSLLNKRYYTYFAVVASVGGLILAGLEYFLPAQFAFGAVFYVLALIYILLTQREAAGSLKNKYIRRITQIDDRDLLLKQSKLLLTSKNIDISEFFGLSNYEVLGEKRQEFSKELKIFYYMDTPLIDSLYNQASSAERAIERTIENSETSSSGVSVVIPPIAPRMKQGSSMKESTKSDIVYSSEKKFDLILNHLLDNNMARLGLENFEYNSKQEDDFLSFCENIKEKSGGFTIPENVKNDFIKFNRKKYVNTTVEKLRQASGYIIMSGVFSIETDAEAYSLVFNHPVSDSMSLVEGASQKLVFKTKVVKSQLTKTGIETFTNTDKIKIILLGNIVKFDDILLELIVSPIAMYA